MYISYIVAHRFGFFLSHLENHSFGRLTIIPKSNSIPSINKPSTSINKSIRFDRNKIIKNYLHKSDKKELYRIDKWFAMLQPSKRDKGVNVRHWQIKSNIDFNKLSKRVCKGVPDRWRSAGWESFILRRIKHDSFPNATNSSSKYLSPHNGNHLSDRLSIRSGNAIQSNRSTSTFNVNDLTTSDTNNENDEFENLINEFPNKQSEPSSYDTQIDLDVPRTISGHSLFHTRYGLGQRNLFHVLHAFSLHQNGYCQGMGPIVATLLCYFEPEKSYAVLALLDKYYNLNQLFAHGFPGLLELLHIQEEIMKKVMPKVYEKFDSENIPPTSYATKWYITLFANVVPFRTQLRLWDLFFLYGPDTLIAFSLSILWCLRYQLSSVEANFESILSTLSNFLLPEDEDSLIKVTYSILSDNAIRSLMDVSRSNWKSKNN